MHFTRLRRPDAAIGFGFAALALLALLAIRRGIGPFGSEATIMPLIGAVALFVFGGLLGLRTVLGLGTSDATAATDEDEPQALDAIGRVRLVVAGVVIFALAWLLPLVGILAGGVLLQVLLFLLIGTRPLTAIAIAFGVVAAVYAGIHLMLGVPLPAGSLW